MKGLNIKSFVSALVLAISLMAAFTIAIAQDGASGKSYGEGSCGAQCYLGYGGADLDLSDAQKTQMQERINRFREATAGLREQLTALRRQSRAVEGGGAVDEASVRAAAQARASLRVELEVAHAGLMSELYALLTPEQKARKAERQRQREERRRQ